MEKVMESDIKVKGDILAQIEDQRNEIVCDVLGLKALVELSMEAAFGAEESKKIKTDWVSVINLFSRSVTGIEEMLDKMDGLIIDLGKSFKENKN